MSNMTTQEVHLTHIITLVNRVTMGLSITALLLSGLTLGVYLVRPDQRILIKACRRSEGVYYLPHSAILAPLMILIFSAFGLVLEILLGLYLQNGQHKKSVQSMALLLPTPLLLWAWLSAFSNVFAWHLTPLVHSSALKRLRFRPIVVDLVCWVSPILVFAAQLTVVNIWPVLLNTGNEKKAALARLLSTPGATSDSINEAHAAAMKAVGLAQYLYRASWGIWAASYGLCWAIYATYSGLLLSMLDRQSELATSSLGPDRRRSSVMTDNTVQQSIVLDGTASHRNLYAATLLAIKRGSVATLDALGSSRSERKIVSKRELLRRNTRLVMLELGSFSVFTLCWCSLATFKSVMGNRLLDRYGAGALTILIELVLSTFFGIVVISLLLRRGWNILRNRQTDVTQSTSTESTSGNGSNSQNQSSAQPERSIASRRSGTALHISLGLSDLVLPSPIGTPGRRASSGFYARSPPFDQHLMSPYSVNPVTPPDFEEKAGTQQSRRSSVTFGQSAFARTTLPGSRDEKFMVTHLPTRSFTYDQGTVSPYSANPTTPDYEEKPTMEHSRRSSVTFAATLPGMRDEHLTVSQQPALSVVEASPAL